MERRYGVPRTDVERAMNHYGITEEQYCANPEAYPLPDRGAGLIGGISAGAAVIIGLILWALFRRK